MILRFHGLKVTDFIAENLTVHGWDGEKSFLSLSTQEYWGYSLAEGCSVVCCW